MKNIAINGREKGRIKAYSTSRQLMNKKLSQHWACFKWCPRWNPDVADWEWLKWLWEMEMEMLMYVKKQGKEMLGRVFWSFLLSPGKELRMEIVGEANVVSCEAPPDNIHIKYMSDWQYTYNKKIKEELSFTSCIRILWFKRFLLQSPGSSKQELWFATVTTGTWAGLLSNAWTKMCRLMTLVVFMKSKRNYQERCRLGD